MTTQQLHFQPEKSSANASGMAIVFFLIGAPNIYSALRQRSQAAVDPTARGGMWAMGLGILTFVVAGMATCFNAMV